MTVLDELRNRYDCRHESTKLTCRPDKNGNRRYQRQCSACGEPIGVWIKKEDAAKEVPLEQISPFDNKLYERGIQKGIQDQRSAVEFALTDMRPMYDEYINSSEWRRKRELVLKREGDICEGCGVAQAVEVHHLTYTNFGREFLWELRAVCAECHERAHPWKTQDRSPIGEMNRLHLFDELRHSPLFRDWYKRYCSEHERTV